MPGHDAPSAGDGRDSGDEPAADGDRIGGTSIATPPSGVDQQVLVEELRRVLDAQQRLVERQRSRASAIVRFVLTAVGLFLTIASLVATTPIGGDAAGDGAGAGVFSATAPGGERTAALLLLAVLCLLTCRILCATLVVLEPRTTAHPLGRMLTMPVVAADRPTSDVAGLGLDRPMALRTGLDADAITTASATRDPTPPVVAYNAGCIAGNAALVAHNRWYLTRAYRSATLAVALATIALLTAIAVLAANGGHP